MTVLTDDVAGLGWEFGEADRAADLLCDIADASGGGLVTPADVTLGRAQGRTASVAPGTAASKKPAIPATRSS